MRLHAIALVLLTSCGASASVAHGGAFVEAIEGEARLDGSVLEQSVQIELAAGRDAAGCTLSARWQSRDAAGEVGLLSPRLDSPTQGSWSIRATLPEGTDVARIESTITCGSETRAMPARYAGDALARYCALCSDRTPPEVRLEGEPSRGFEIFARIGVAARVRGALLVDACDDRTLLDLSTIPEARLLESPPPEEDELELSFASEHGEDVCARGIVAGAIAIEVTPASSDALLQGLRTIPELARIERMAPPPP